MNTQNLILTSTKDMSRADWLEWRKPLVHVKKFIGQWLFEKGIIADASDFDYTPSQLRTDILKQVFTSQEWKDFVFPCIGGSEISSVMGLNQYESSIEIYFKKVGVWPSERKDNVFMFWGREHESQIADKWQYWDGDEESMINNFSEGKVIRRCSKINAYIQNKDFPYLSFSLDRRIHKTDRRGEGLLECKFIGSWAANQWESGFPPGYVVQIQQGMGVLNWTFGESAILKDGRNMDVLPFERNENIINAIKEKGEKFYLDVKKGIEFYLLSLVAPDEQTRLNNLAIVEKLAPEPDGSVSYENYLKQKNEDKGYEINGTDTEYGWAVEHEALKERGDALEIGQREYSNRLKNAMGEASTLNFGERGKITWKANKNGTRVFKVSLKTV